MKASILIGDVIDKLRTLPSDSVHCVITSPPYYGLRDYGLPPSVWGGDVNCDHVWATETIATEVGRGNWAQGVNGRGEEQPGGVDAKREPIRATAERGFCAKCDAWLGCLGLEPTPQLFLKHMTSVFQEVRRVLRPDGTCWVNMGDSYASAPSGSFDKGGRGSGALQGGGFRANKPFDTGVASGLKPKDLMGMPWRLAFALQDDGWWLRQDIIWSKPNPMPESVTDRCTKAHEYLFLLTKSAKYYYDADAIREKATADHPAGNTSHKGATAYLEGDERHRTKQGLVAYASRNGKNSFRGQGSNRDGENGPVLREGRDMSVIGTSGTRNKRSVWEIATEPFPEAHFATFPTKLVEPCILAGTSEKGVCDNCWTPWVRETEKTVAFASGSGRSGIVPEGKHAGGAQEDSGDYDIRMGPVTSTKTVGWKRGCSCETDTAVPSTVLDPFNGSGTTGLVALANRCNYIGIELNPDYAAMAQRRIDALLAQEVMVFA